MTTNRDTEGRRGRQDGPKASYHEAFDARDRLRYKRGSRLGGQAQPERTFAQSLAIVRYVFFAALAVVAIRLVWLQVIQGGSLSSQAEASRTNVVTLRAKRGTIYDRNGNVLAMSVDCKTIYANPKEVHDPSGVAEVLAQYLGGSAQDYLSTLTQDTTFAYVKRQVDEDVAEKIKAELTDKDLSGIYYLEDSKREYPYGSVAGQVLGAVGADGQGLTGLEYYYDDILTGTDGQMILETGLTGTPIAGGVSEETPAKNGTDIVISIDVDLQQRAENELVAAVEEYSAESGSVCVMNPSTGEIYAACSTPLADVSDLSNTSSDALGLKLVTNSYEPGSVFKVLTTSIGMEAGLFDQNTSYNIPVTIQVGWDTVTDDDSRTDWMYMSLREMMRRSSNVAMAYLVQNVIGSKTFAEGVAGYGIGSKTGIDYPGESQGIVKSYEEYDQSTAGFMSFGQSVAVPMIQVVRAYACVANDGTLVTPHFLVSKGDQTVDWPTSPGPISKATADEETDMMRYVMTEGTGRLGQVEGYDIAGKTGTGEQASESGGYESYHYVASLCGFANADDPQVLTYVGLNGLPHLAWQSAAPLFSAVMGEALTDLSIPPAS